jgi:hypothetical protein
MGETRWMCVSLYETETLIVDCDCVTTSDGHPHEGSASESSANEAGRKNSYKLPSIQTILLGTLSSLLSATVRYTSPVVQ